MDKETLSNYGWIVICVLVLAVMIALATPFGTFVADAVKSTTQGLFDVNQNALNSTGLINIDGQTFGEGGNGGAGNGGSGEQGGSGLPAVGTSAEDCTWDEIKAISEAGKGDEYFNLGDTKTVTTTDGKTIVMEIVAFNADIKADGTGTAGITWISKNIIAKRAMNSSSTNKNGWAASEARNWLQNDFLNTLTNELKVNICLVNKTYYDYASKLTLSCDDNLWIPSFKEIMGEDNVEDSGCDYSAFFATATSRKKSYNGTFTDWWLRSAPSTNNMAFRKVDSDGSGYSNHSANNSGHGVVLGFCT